MPTDTTVSPAQDSNSVVDPGTAPIPASPAESDPNSASSSDQGSASLQPPPQAPLPSSSDSGAVSGGS